MRTDRQDLTPLPLRDGRYQSPGGGGLLGRRWPSLRFYPREFWIVYRAACSARRGTYDDREWLRSSQATLRALERVGVRLEISGLEHVAPLREPVVFIGNHMSTMETFLLPGILVPFLRVTFVVKQSLVDYPIFGHVMRSRDPITVGRVNPREDLTAVLEGGRARIGQGVSLVIFPQTTRTAVFDPAEFNSIGVKLAKRADVAVIPFAVKTDAWGNGRLAKDYGRIDPAKTAHIAFGPPLRIAGRGAEEHEAVVRFVSARLREWGGQIKG
jgi:1-acyl-sn-glycerol-3-phosphate acyltransferase